MKSFLKDHLNRMLTSEAATILTIEQQDPSVLFVAPELQPVNIDKTPHSHIDNTLCRIENHFELVSRSKLKPIIKSFHTSVCTGIEHPSFQKIRDIRPHIAGYESRRLITLPAGCLVGEQESEARISKACAKGKLSQISQLLKFYSPNYCETGSRTPLVEAIVHGHYFAARSILKAGASVDVLDSQGRTALHWAALFGGREIAQLLIHHGANATIYDSEGRNVVHLGTLNRKSTLGFLLKELLRRTTASQVRRLLNDGDKENMTPLHLVVCQNNHENLKALIQLGRSHLDALITDVEGKTALHWTAPHKSAVGSTSCSSILLDSYPSLINLQDFDGRTVLHLACGENNANLVKMLLSKPNCDPNIQDVMGRTPLHWASVSGSGPIVNALLQNGAVDGVMDEGGATPLHYACSKNHAQCVIFLMDPKFHQVTYIPDREGKHPLTWAVRKGHAQTCKILLERGVDPNFTDFQRQTALHFAAFAGHIVCASCLLEYGAHVDMRDDHLRTPLFRAVERGFADMCSALLSFGADVNAKDGDGRSPLHWASILGFVSVLSVLIANRADHNTTDKTGRTPLHGASYYARDVAVKYLVEIGAEINASDFNGVTALHWAAGLGHVTTIQLLAQLGAKLNSLDNHSDYRLTPLDYALISGHHECIDLIHELGGFTGREVLELSVLTIQRVWRGYTIRRLNPSEDRKVGRKVAKQVQIVSSISPFSLNTSPIVINASYHIETGLDLDSEFFLDPNDLHWLQPGGGVS